MFDKITNAMILTLLLGGIAIFTSSIVISIGFFMMGSYFFGLLEKSSLQNKKEYSD